MELTGTFIGNARGFGFVRLDGCAECPDAFIPPDCTNGAIHGDTVLIEAKPSGDGRREGCVLKILRRQTNAYVGTFYAGGEKTGGGFIVPCEPKNSYKYVVTKKTRDFFALAGGHRVSFRAEINQKDPSNPVAVVVEVIGHMNDPGVDV
ncbi:MAG: ribonuclease R, partial [Defluviitaleaceae bacterium]|nr:ribonuclease R [Defluviitaleaceae bacterium]